jgi:hypothetical protein
MDYPTQRETILCVTHEFHLQVSRRDVHGQFQKRKESAKYVGAQLWFVYGSSVGRAKGRKVTFFFQI